MVMRSFVIRYKIRRTKLFHRVKRPKRKPNIVKKSNIAPTLLHP